MSRVEPGRALPANVTQTAPTAVRQADMQAAAVASMRLQQNVSLAHTFDGIIGPCMLGVSALQLPLHLHPTRIQLPHVNQLKCAMIARQLALDSQVLASAQLRRQPALPFDNTCSEASHLLIGRLPEARQVLHTEGKLSSGCTRSLHHEDPAGKTVAADRASAPTCVTCAGRCAGVSSSKVSGTVAATDARRLGRPEGLLQAQRHRRAALPPVVDAVPAARGCRPVGRRLPVHGPLLLPAQHRPAPRLAHV